MLLRKSYTATLINPHVIGSLFTVEFYGIRNRLWSVYLQNSGTAVSADIQLSITEPITTEGVGVGSIINENEL